MGELARIYSAGDFNFCGGSLVDCGGHNVMEAARWGRPVYYGPSMHDFSDASGILKNSGAGFQVADGTGLARIILQHINDVPLYQRACKNAADVTGLQRGSARKQAEMVKKLLVH
jgi:3-deoxy-D-manno-octulosonic-acid transferase